VIIISKFTVIAISNVTDGGATFTTKFLERLHLQLQCWSSIHIVGWCVLKRKYFGPINTQGFPQCSEFQSVDVIKIFFISKKRKIMSDLRHGIRCYHGVYIPMLITKITLEILWNKILFFHTFLT
jgi:hypothetical protein